MTNILNIDLGTNTGWALPQQNRLGDTQQHGVDAGAGAGDKTSHLASSDITQQNRAWAGNKVNYPVTSGTIGFKNHRFQSGGLTAVYFEEVL